MTTFARVRTLAVTPTVELNAQLMAELHERFAGLRPLRIGSRSLLLEARDNAADGQRVVLKLPSATDARWAVDAVAREGQILTKIGSHPHIVRLTDRLLLADGRPILVLERCAGSLDDLAGAYQPGLRNILTLGVKLCSALETVHSKGLLHTDVRPANVYLTAGGAPALGGFDEALSADPAEMPRHALHATTQHTAPELLEGATASAATDVYGLAVTMYELVAGHPAFPRYRGESASETGLRILRGARAPLSADVPIELADLLAWALAIDPARRPPSPAWLSEELRRIGPHLAPLPPAE